MQFGRTGLEYIERRQSFTIRSSRMAENFQLVFFCLGATCNLLASPQNRGCQGFEVDTDCALCRKEEASIAHKLTGCQKALQSGIYTFLHNTILVVIRHHMQVMINQVQKEIRKVGNDGTIIFMKEGVEPRKTSWRKYDKLGILHEAKD